MAGKREKKLKGGRWCSAPTCSANSNTHRTSFFSFPLNSDRCRTWIVNCNRSDLLEKSTEYCHKNCTLCSGHFEERMFLNDLKNRLKSDAVPTIFHWSPTAQQSGEQQPITLASTSLTAITPEQSSICSRESSPIPSTSYSPQSSTSSTQTPHSLSSHSPRKEKLHRNLKSSKLVSKRLMFRREHNAEEEELANFHRLCDKYLPVHLSNLIKIQVKCGKSSKQKYSY